jgi:hypothetical protein
MSGNEKAGAVGVWPTTPSDKNVSATHDTAASPPVQEQSRRIGGAYHD